LINHRTSRWLVLPAILILALVFAGCTGVTKPEGWAGPTLAEQTLLVAHKSKLYALDSTSFEARWIFPSSTGTEGIKPRALYGTPAIENGVVYIPTYSNKLYAVELATGKLKWTSPFKAGDTLVGGVLASAGKVYFGSSDGSVYAVDGETGGKDWSFSTGDEVWSTPVLSGTTLFITSLDGRLYALDSASGEELWSYETAAGVAATPVLGDADGLIYVGGFDARLRAIDVATHEQRWVAKATNWFWATPLLANGVVYAGGLDGKVYALDADSGQAHWDRPFKTNAEIRAAPVMAGNVLVVVDRGGHVYALDPQDGTMAPPQELELGADVLADPFVLPSGEVLIATTGGELVRIDPAKLEIVSRTKLGS